MDSLINEKIFLPLLIKEQGAKYLKLNESNLRRIFLFVFFRIFPLVILIAVITFLFSFDTPLKIQGLMVLIIILILPIMFKTYILEIDISDTEIKVISQAPFGKRTETVSVSNIEKIEVQTYYFNNGGGYYYKLVLKGGKKKIPLLNIPYLYMNMGNKKEINRILEGITGLEVSSTWSDYLKPFKKS